jgi:hypothetical protein
LLKYLYQLLYFWADFSSFKAALAAIGQLSSLLLGKSIHSKTVKFGVECSIFFAKCLTDMYGERGVAEDSKHGVSNKMKDKDTISWNSIVTAYLNRYRVEDARVILFIGLLSFIIIIIINVSFKITRYVKRGPHHMALIYWSNMVIFN